MTEASDIGVRESTAPAKPAGEGSVAHSRAVLAHHSRSFRWASTFLPPDSRDDAAVVYAFCRLVDDTADETDQPAKAALRLDRLRRELDEKAPPRPAVHGFLDVARRRGIDLASAHELVRGVASDLECVRCQNDEDLLRYCYRVAGTVGLMMCGVLGVDDPQALPHAVDLGVAMQLTNICRDVVEDAARGRVYLPADRLAAAGTCQEALLAGDADRDAVASVVSDLLALADDYYTSADYGMRFIPARCRLAIVVASRVYRAIGVKLAGNGSDALAGRTVVGPGAKLWWVLVSLWAFMTPTVTGLRRLDDHDARLHQALRGLPGTSDL